MRLLLASAIAGSTAALTALIVVSSAAAETKTYELSGFKKIEASAGFTIEFAQSPTWSVVVDSRHDNLDLVIVEKVGDTLRIKRPQKTRQVKELHDIVRISAPDLDALKLDAAIEFNAKKLNLDTLSIDANAAIQINIADLRVDALNVDMDAASELVVAGTCNTLKLDLGAATSVDTRGLKCREAHIDAGVASEVQAYASEKAVANAGISSSILISGKPGDFRKSESRFGSSVSLAN